MSDNIVSLNNQNRGVGDNRDQEPNARLKWIADLVCAILDAESMKRSSSVVNDRPHIKTQLY